MTDRLIFVTTLILSTASPFSVARPKLAITEQLRKAAIAEREARPESIPVTKNAMGTRLSAGPGVAILGKSVGFSGNVEIAFKASSEEPLYFGFDLGYSMWGSDSGDASAVMILPSLVYHFERARSAAFHPYFGISSGIAAVKMHPTIDLGLGAPDADRTLFAFLFRAGVASHAVTEAFAIGIETKFGYVDPSFLFLPQIRLTSGF